MVVKVEGLTGLSYSLAVFRVLRFLRERRSGDVFAIIMVMVALSLERSSSDNESVMREST